MLSRLLPFLLCATMAWGDVAVPPRVLNPQSAAEAWNVLRLVTANVRRLLDEDRPAEIPTQISLASPALRALVQYAPTVAQRAPLTALTTRAALSINALAVAGTAGHRPSLERDFAAFRGALEEAAPLFDPQVVAAEVAVCPMHPDCLATDPATPCPKCGMHLLKRRIPYSFIYTRPGEPSVTLRATPAAPLARGTPVTVNIDLHRRDGAPVLPDDLTVLHTEPIHLLIVDPALGDYHHEHPRPTDIPGRYTFTFTPRTAASYRIFADIVPVDTGVQEYPFTDLPGVEKGAAASPVEPSLTSETGGLRFTLTFPRNPANALRAGQAHAMTLTVAELDGRPVQRLAPVMAAFAHAVGFYEDHRTVVHLHPTGGDILNEEARGGSALGFTFFPPRPGYLRLYCQVLVEGQMLFAPFDLQIAPP